MWHAFGRPQIGDVGSWPDEQQPLEDQLGIDEPERDLMNAGRQVEPAGSDADIVGDRPSPACLGLAGEQVDDPDLAAVYRHAITLAVVATDVETGRGEKLNVDRPGARER